MKLHLGSAIALALVATIGAVATGSANAGDSIGRRTVTLGRSVQGQPIRAIEIGDLDSANKALVVGCIHGNESAGVAVAMQLARSAPPKELDLWIIPNLNPDGVTADSRGNSHGVDLNRNFPWRWQRLSGLFYSGRRPLSEPESRIAYRLISKLRPNVAIWFHQHLDVVDSSGGSLPVERRFAALTGLHLARLTREPGSAVGWENHRVHRGAAFVVELPAGTLSTSAVGRFANAVLTVSRVVAPRSA